jgi:hypothetical protein
MTTPNNNSFSQQQQEEEEGRGGRIVFDVEQQNHHTTNVNHEEDIHTTRLFSRIRLWIPTLWNSMIQQYVVLSLTHNLYYSLKVIF